MLLFFTIRETQLPACLDFWQLDVDACVDTLVLVSVSAPHWSNPHPPSATARHLQEFSAK